MQKGLVALIWNGVANLKRCAGKHGYRERREDGPLPARRSPPLSHLSLATIVTTEPTSAPINAPRQLAHPWVGLRCERSWVKTPMKATRVSKD